ncbi:hypothetical protein KFU94_00695 [Chloroflexi bacterium TSY]|nr:hypothetical protein [Chloroflexi bacterium TSY]
MKPTDIHITLALCCAFYIYYDWYTLIDMAGFLTIVCLSGISLVLGISTLLSK